MEGNEYQYRVDRADAVMRRYLELDGGDPDDWGDCVTGLMTDLLHAATAFLGPLHGPRIVERSWNRALDHWATETG